MKKISWILMLIVLVLLAGCDEHPTFNVLNENYTVCYTEDNCSSCDYLSDCMIKAPIVNGMRKVHSIYIVGNAFPGLNGIAEAIVED